MHGDRSGPLTPRPGEESLARPTATRQTAPMTSQGEQPPAERTDPAAYRTIRYSIADGVARVELHRPDRMNAFTPRMAAELVDAADRWDEDDSVRAVIFTGSGRSFCAGADLGAGRSSFDAAKTVDRVTAAEATSSLPRMEHPRGNDADARRDLGGWVTLRFFRSTKPLIAAVHGAAAGIGVTMTLPMDIRLCTPDARFGFVFAARGIVAEACSSWFLPRIVGISRALEWCLASRMVPASEALEAGLVSAIVDPDDLAEAATARAQEIAANSAPVSVALTRQMMWQMLGASHPGYAHRIESRGVAYTGRQPDAAEGIAAFFERRPADWRLAPSRDMPDWFPWVDEPPFE